MRFYTSLFPAVLFLSLVLAGPAVNAESATAEKSASQPGASANSGNDRANVSDFWRAVRGGKTGYVADPRSQSGLLITDWPKDCVEAGNCTERAVGFTLPIHDLMPVVREPEGQGVEWQTLAFVIGLFSALLIAGAVFVRTLGAER